MRGFLRPLGIDAQHVGMFGLVTPSWIERNHDEFEIDGLLARRDLDLRAKHAERPGQNLHRFYPLCLLQRIRLARTPTQKALDVGTIGAKVMSEKLRMVSLGALSAPSVPFSAPPPSDAPRP